MRSWVLSIVCYLKWTSMLLFSLGCGRFGFEVSGGPDGVGARNDAILDRTGDGMIDPTPLDLFAMCPTTPAISDDFEGTTVSIGPAGNWASTYGTNVVAWQNQGRLVITFPTNAASGENGGVYSPRLDASNACAIVKVEVLPDPTTPAIAYLMLKEAMGATPKTVYVSAGGGTLQLRKDLGGSVVDVGTIPYDPVQHRWFRLRTGTNGIAWETSGDGATWIKHHEEASFLNLSSVLLLIGAEAGTGAMNAGSAELDTARFVVP